MMNYNLVPSLEHIALVNVTAILWNKQDIRTLLRKFSNSSLFSKLDDGLPMPGLPTKPSKRKQMWDKIQITVGEMASQLTITMPSKEKILNYIQPVGLQVLRWMEYHYRNYVSDLPKHFCWSPQGIIDKKKTVEILIEDETIHVGLRYKLACIYCCEDDIPKLWDKLPESSREFYYDMENPCNVMQHELVVFWTYYTKGEIDRYDSMIRDRSTDKCSPYENAFQFAAVSGNKAATKYFLQKLTSKQCLVNTAIQVAKKHRGCFQRITDTPKEYYTDVLCFLLSEMNYEQQIEVFKDSAFKVLSSLLDWPWQCYFVETATHLFNFLDASGYHCILWSIIQNRINGCITTVYPKLFRDFWQKTTDTHKRNLINSHCIPSIICDLTLIKDKENFKLLLQDASLMEKKNIIFSKIGRNICENIIHNEEWEFVKYFIQACISSKNEFIQFKQECQQQTDFIDPRKKNYKDKRQKFYLLLDELARDSDKRKIIDEGDSSLPKRLCTEN